MSKFIKNLKNSVRKYRVSKYSDLDKGFKKDAEAIKNDWKKIINF